MPMAGFMSAGKGGRPEDRNLRLFGVARAFSCRPSTPILHPRTLETLAVAGTAKYSESGTRVEVLEIRPHGVENWLSGTPTPEIDFVRSQGHHELPTEQPHVIVLHRTS